MCQSDCTGDCQPGAPRKDEERERLVAELAAMTKQRDFYEKCLQIIADGLGDLTTKFAVFLATESGSGQ